MSSTLRILGIISGFAVCQGQTVTVTSVANGASFTGRVTQGAYITIFGSNFVPTGTSASAPAVPFPTTLAGVSVSVAGVPCPIYYVIPTQINLLLPWNIPGGTDTLVVTAAGQTVGPLSIFVSTTAPGIFQFGNNRAVATNQDGSLNNTGNPAASGSTITVYLTGLGPVTNIPPDGGTTPLSGFSTSTLLSSATFGGVNARITFLGLTPGSVGLAQANIVVPNLASGDYPLVINIGGILTPSAEISVSGAGSALPQVFSQIGAVQIPTNNLRVPLQGGFNGTIAVAVSGNYAYLCDANRIAIVDVSNPASPQYVTSFGQLDIGGAGAACTLYQGNLIEETSGEVIVYSLLIPTAPQRIGVQAQFRAGNLLFSGPTGFVSSETVTFDSGFQITGQQGEFYAYDFTDPTNPRFRSQLQPNPNQPGSANGSLRFGFSVFNNQTAIVLGTNATGTNTNGQALFTTIDVSNPSNMAALGQTLLPQSSTAVSIALNGNIGLIAGNTTGFVNPLPFDLATANLFNVFGGFLTLHTVDFTNPRSPTVLSSYVTSIPASTGYALSPFGNNFFAITIGPPLTDLLGPTTLAVIDARNPVNPIVWPQITVQGMQGQFSSGGKLYAAVGSGLNVYSVRQLP